MQSSRTNPFISQSSQFPKTLAIGNFASESVSDQSFRKHRFHAIRLSSPTKEWIEYSRESMMWAREPLIISRHFQTCSSALRCRGPAAWRCREPSSRLHTSFAQLARTIICLKYLINRPGIVDKCTTWSMMSPFITALREHSILLTAAQHDR